MSWNKSSRILYEETAEYLRSRSSPFHRYEFILVAESEFTHCFPFIYTIVVLYSFFFRSHSRLNRINKSYRTLIKCVLCVIVCVYVWCSCGCLCGCHFSCRALLCRIYLNNKMKCVSLIVSSSIDTKMRSTVHGYSTGHRKTNKRRGIDCQAYWRQRFERIYRTLKFRSHLSCMWFYESHKSINLHQIN